MAVMIEVQILIPLADNAGVAFTTAHHAGFEQELIRLFRGWQLAAGTVSGEWLDPNGTIYPDELRVYTVAIEGMIQAADSLTAIVAFAKAYYAQHAIYVRYLGASEIL
jgi:hypothetical protein